MNRTRLGKLAAALVLAVLAWGLVAEGQAVSKAVLYVRKLIGLGGTVEVVGQLRASPVVTSLVYPADAGLLVFDGGGIVIPCANTLPSCSSTVNRGTHLRLCSTDVLYHCAVVSATIGYAWMVADGIQRYPFASKVRAGGSAPEEGDAFSGSTPLLVDSTIHAVECVVTSQGAGAGQAVVTAIQDGGTKCRFNFPCAQAINLPAPLDGGIWQGPFMCLANELDKCTPPGPCSQLQVSFHADSACNVNGLPGLTCDAITRRYLKVP